MERILITQLGFLGDVILSTPVFSELRKIYKDVELTVLTTKAAVPLVEYHPAVNNVIAYDKRGEDRGSAGFFKIREQLKNKGFTAIFSLHRSIRTSLLHASLGVKPSFGFTEAKGAFLYTKTVSRKDYAHDVLRNLSILKAIDIDPLTLTPKLEVGLPEEIISSISTRLPERFLAVFPGSVWPTKRWTVEGFAELCKKLVARGENVLLGGGPTDSGIAAEIEKLAGGTVSNLVGKLPLIESAALISKATAVITNDSAPLHLASAFKRPTIALFCSTIPEFGFGPWETPSEVVQVTGLSCKPCGRHGKVYCPTGTHACQTGIPAQAVLEALDRVLQK